jgi:ABC-type Fe3+-hydroxamate transport system substrate-binding protein
MPVATSSERISRHDPVSFELTMSPKAGTVVGHIHLKLLASRPRTMKGRFTVVVTDQDGTVVAREALQRVVVLHPQARGRSAALRIPVRLASGSYGAFARFTSI